MSRAERRRNARCKAKGKLTDSEIAALEQKRRTREDSELQEQRALFVALVNAVRRSPVLPLLHRRLRNHPGSKSKFPLVALVVLVLLNWKENSDYLRVHIFKVLATLDPQHAYDIGLCTTTEWVPITLNMVYKQYKRLESALEELVLLPDGSMGLGWIDEEDGTHCGPEWLMEQLVNATVPRQVRRQCKTFAIDETAYVTFARVVNFTKQKIAESRGEMPSKDKHAKMGRKTPTEKNPGEMFCGFTLMSCLAMPEPIWDGKPGRKPAFGYHPPPFVMAAKLTPAGGNPGRTGREIVLQAETARQAEDNKNTAAQVKRVMADRGISDKDEFVSELLKHNIRPIFDYKSNQISRPDPIHKRGRDGRIHSVIMQAGTIFPDWIPPDLLVPAAREDRRHKPGPYTKRAERWRYSLHKVDLVAQTAHFKCPVHAGRITYPGSTITPNKHAIKVDGPGPGQPCCNGLVSIPIDELGQYQDIPWGTVTWRSLYRHFRAVMEGLHGAIRNNGGLDAESCRVFNIAAHTIAATAALVIWNIRLAIRHGLTETDDTAPHETDDTTDPDLTCNTDAACDIEPTQKQSPH